MAIVIHDEAGRFLSVRRPEEDASLPGVWGLPAVSLIEGEAPEEAAVRAGRQKLGVDVRVGRRVGTDCIARKTFILHLTEFEVMITAGVPSVPQVDESVTQYDAMRYTDDVSTLFAAARAGSACSRIFLRDRNVVWR